MKQITIISKKHGSRNVLLDDEDFDKVSQYKWSIYGCGKTLYATRRISKKQMVILHRFLMNETNPKIMIDHVDHNGLNCQKNNMRRCDKRTNARNSTAQFNSTSKYLGVSIHISKSIHKGKIYEYWRWNAKINIPIDGKRKGISLGVYEDEVNAAKAYNSAALKYYGEFANINVI